MPGPRLREVGRALGVLGFILFSHALVYYLWICNAYYRGAAVYPHSWADIGPFCARMAQHIAAGAAPTATAFALYLGFLSFEFVLAAVMPGPRVNGLPVASEGGIRHTYLCNGAASWYVTLAVALVLHATGIFRLTTFADQLGPMLTVAILCSNALAIATSVVTVARGKQTRMSGNPLVDFFMGAILNPRVGHIDLKFFTEIRVSWILLFFLTLGAAAKEHALRGRISAPMLLMLVAHGLYTNACMKGEECIPTTWDIFYEKWGWMLIFWNLVGVPWVYSFNSYYILANDPIEHTPLFVGALFLALLAAYYVWDTAQSQRNRFRMQERGTFFVRRTFPQLPWGTLKNPRYLATANGGTLLVDGWWAFARKIHYTADIVMATCWALACGFGSPLPYFYPTFFFVMIMHRAHRDEKRCRAKYGADWERYREVVPYRFVPYVV